MRYLLGGAVAVSLISLTAASGLAESSSTLYLNRQQGFQLEIPSQWGAHDHTSPEMAPLLKTGRDLSGQNEPSIETPLAVVVSEFPLNASVPFNTNITVSFYERAGKGESLEETLRGLAAKILQNIPIQDISRIDQSDQPIEWIVGECRYVQQTRERTVPIVARLAIAKDSSRSRYVLMTMSSLESDIERYGEIFLACLKSFRWLDNGN